MVTSVWREVNPIEAAQRRERERGRIQEDHGKRGMVTEKDHDTIQ